jgi:hypothetical protein
MIEPFSLREVFTVSGQPGLWKIKSYSAAMGIAVMSKLVNPKQTVRAKTSDLSPIESIRISTTLPEFKPPPGGFSDPNIVTVATVFESIWNLKQSGSSVRSAAEFEACDKETQSSEILLVMQHADLSKFLPSHYVKILRWYADLETAMSMLEPAIDPYDELNLKIR